MAYTLLRYSLPSLHEVSFYSLGTAEGTMARTLSEFSRGKIQSLSCSPNEENLRCFMAFGKPPHADFFLGPFHRLSKNHLRSDSKLARFAEGFDFIFEDTTFQMYSPNRLGQIEFVSQHLKPDGIFLFLEKFRSADERDYAGRESQKDFGFKSHYFDVDEIERKSIRVLTTMHDCEVTLEDMAHAIYTYFRHCVVTWNSGNFYGLAASNSHENLLRYLASMPEPAIPGEYVYEPVPWLELSLWLKRQTSAA
ncbi:class I SAM-dependent methyltransferase [Agrobacterium tumefaciens]|uniref:class I SAM-dependent methyltransferase n=1 Tax=Agrobacterium tumefaciens TaxID=358 RepID=UPI001FFD1054|nr:class I SAM-dependent methyltransferase [Agrobacterium tumefaciens]